MNNVTGGCLLGLVFIGLLTAIYFIESEVQRKFTFIVGASILQAIVFAEYFPTTFASGLDVLWITATQPFSEYRNGLAVKYAFAGAGIGLIAAFIWLKSRHEFGTKKNDF